MFCPHRRENAYCGMYMYIVMYLRSMISSAFHHTTLVCKKWEKNLGEAPHCDFSVGTVPPYCALPAG